MPQASLQESSAGLDAALAAGAVVLVPNHRSSQQLQHAWNQRRMRATRSTVLALPAIRAIDPWLEALWQQLALLHPAPVLGWHILQPVQELLLWRQVIADSPAGAMLLNLEGTASSARNTWRLLQQHRITPAELRSELNFARLPGEVADDRLIFQQWLSAFLALCRQQQLLTFGDVLGTLLAWCTDDAAALRSVLPPALLLSGFDEPPPLYRDLLAAFERIGISVSSSPEHAWQPAMQVQEFAEATEECRAAAEWALAVIGAEPAATIGIICPDLQRLHPALTRIFAQTFAATLPSPALALPDLRPLAEQPFIATALQLLELHQDSCDTLLLCQLLRSPWLLGADAEADGRARLELRLRNRGEQRTSLATLRSDCMQEGKTWYCPLLGAALLAANGHFLNQRPIQPLHNWLACFARVWAALLDVERLAASGRLALATAWEQLQERAAQSGFLFPAGRIAAALTLVQSSARESTLPMPGGAAQVQILTPIESAGLQFTHLWCMQMVETHWPEQRAPSPWLPLTLQKARQLPGADPQLLLQRSRTLLAKLLAATATATVFSYSQFDKDLPLRPSQLLAVVKQPAGPQTDTAETQPLPGALHPALRSFTGARTEALPDTTRLPLREAGAYQGPGALLANQASCPFRAFAIHRLASDELRPLSYGLPPHATGTLVHRTLEHFWDTLRSSHQLQHSSAAEIQLAIFNAVGTALRETAFQYPHTLTPRYQEVTKAHLARLLQAWLAEERRRGAFTVIASEQSLHWRFANLELRLRIDRIDRAEDGSSVVIDYKTGRLGSVDWEAQRQDNPQLMLYQQAVAQNGRHAPVSAVLHARVNLEEVKYSGIGADQQVLPEIAFSANRYVSSASWDELLQHWQHSLQQLAQEFLDGHVAVQPKSPRSCDYCHLGSFCRIAELEGAR